MKNPKKPLAWVALLILTTVGCGHSGPDNVLLIVVDTLRADHLSLYGYDRPTSPELERWAERVRAQPWSEVFVFFKHEETAGGPELASRFSELFEAS